MLKRDGYLEVQPGVGMVVGRPAFRDPALRRELLGDSVEGLVLRARELGVGMEELTESVKEHWERMEP
jgi:DNA-binding transcriptional regulator YhcF (GntR family)